MGIQNPRTYSDLPIPPGKVLAEEIAARGMTEKELAVSLGISVQAVNEIIKGEMAITPDTASGLGRSLGISPQFWIALEADYRRAALAARNDGDPGENCCFKRASGTSEQST